MGCPAITGYRFRSWLVDTDVHRRPGRASGRGLCIYRLSDAGKYARRFVFFVWNGVQHHIRLKKMLTKRGNLSASAYRRSSSGASGKECPSTAACFRNVSTKGSSPRRSQKPTHSVSTNYWTKRNGFALHRKSLISSRRRYLPVLRETGKSRKRRR